MSVKKDKRWRGCGHGEGQDGLLIWVSGGRFGVLQGGGDIDQDKPGFRERNASVRRVPDRRCTDGRYIECEFVNNAMGGETL